MGATFPLPEFRLESLVQATKLLADDVSADGSGSIFIGGLQRRDGRQVFDVIQSQIGEERLLHLGVLERAQAVLEALEVLHHRGGPACAGIAAVTASPARWRSR